MLKQSMDATESCSIDVGDVYAASSKSASGNGVASMSFRISGKVGGARKTVAVWKSTLGTECEQK